MLTPAFQPSTSPHLSEARALQTSSPQLGNVINSITSNPNPRVTPVIRANTAALPCSPGSSGQVSPVTRSNAPELASFQPSQATAASFSSLSANTQATNKKDNNSFKRMHFTQAMAIYSSSTSCKYLIKYHPSFSRPFHQPWVLTAQASALSQSRDQHFGNSRNFNNTAFLGDASCLSAPL